MLPTMEMVWAALKKGAAFILDSSLLTITPFEKNLYEMLAPAAHDLGYEIVRIRLMGSKRQTLQIMAERADGSMNSGDCAVLSRAISPILEANDPIASEYYLEVSSPGIDRPLTRLKDFERWAGYKAKLELDRTVDGKKRFSGDLVGIEDDNIQIDLDGEEDTALIPFAWLHNAKLVLTDELIKASLARRPKNDELDNIEAAIDSGELELEDTDIGDENN